MNNIKYLVILFSTACCFIINSCDDSGQNPVFVPKGLITFTAVNMKPLNAAVDGLYSLWVKLDSSGTPKWYNLGQFNIGQTGEVVDANGNPMIFTYTGDTNMLWTATKSTVTVGNDPTKSVIMGVSLTVYPDSITGSYWIRDELALGDPFGEAVLNGHYGRYLLSTPTDNNANCLKGLWLTDTLGNGVWPDNPDLSSGKGWVMQGWIHDELNNTFLSFGRFYSFNSADNDGAGYCAGSNAPYNKPGSDWVQTGCAVNNLNNGHYGVFITVEPEYETPSSPGWNSPFPFKLFYHADISTGCRQSNWVYSEANTGNMPKGKIKITN